MNAMATLTLASVIFDQAVNESCYQGDDSVLKSLVEIADTAPKYLRPNLEATLQLCLKVSWNTLLQKYHFTALDTQMKPKTSLYMNLVVFWAKIPLELKNLQNYGKGSKN